MRNPLLCDASGVLHFARLFERDRRDTGADDFAFRLSRAAACLECVDDDDSASVDLSR